MKLAPPTFPLPAVDLLHVCACVTCSFVGLLLSHMSVEELREEACDCLLEIVNKGMDPLDKTKLVESLSRVLQSAGFFNVEQVKLFFSFFKPLSFYCPSSYSYIS